MYSKTINTQTIVDLFFNLYQENPSKNIFSFIDESGHIQTQLTRQDLHIAALKLASHLTHQLGLEAGKRVLLAYPQSLDFIVALLACLYAGIIPIPISPPNPYRDIKYELKNLCQIADTSEASAILTNSFYLNVKKVISVKNMLTLNNQTWTNLPWHTTDKVKAEQHASAFYRPKLTDTAYIQFTSGSTSDPKGVMISYANLSHQVKELNHVLSDEQDVKAVIWVPQYHSTCLVSVIFTALQYGHMIYFFSPLDFLKKPSIWLDIITKFSATHTTAPCFALELLLNSIKNKNYEWDLSSLKMLCVGGESNKQEIISKFTEALCVYGLNKNTICPGYGMTEHTVSISMTRISDCYQTISLDKKALQHNQIQLINTSSSQSVTFVSNGKPLNGVDLKIVNPDTRTLSPQNTIGEIWVSSPSVASGYYNLPHANTFSAELVNALSNTKFLRTGDLGVLYEGNLYITGRIKDMLNINGRNIYYEDIEKIVLDCAPAFSENPVMAFSLNDTIVVAIESKNMNRDIFQHLCQVIRGKIAQLAQVNCKSFIFCKKGTFLYTKTGKIRRHPTKQLFMNGTLNKKIIYEEGIVFSKELYEEVHV